MAGDAGAAWLDDRDALMLAQRRSRRVARDWLNGEAHCAMRAAFDAVEPMAVGPATGRRTARNDDDAQGCGPVPMLAAASTGPISRGPDAPWREPVAEPTIEPSDVPAAGRSAHDPGHKAGPGSMPASPNATADGEAGALADVAERLFADTAWVGVLLAPLIAALRAEPAFEPPLRVHRDALRVGAVLIDTPRVGVTATVLSADAPARLCAPQTVVASARLSVVCYVRAGGARLRRWRAEPIVGQFSAATAPPACAMDERRLRDGEVVRHDGRVEAHLLDDAQADVVTLTATIRIGAAPVMREYAVADGRLVRAGALDDVQSRTHMLLTMLRVAGRADAAPVFAAATRDDGFQVRWSAMREWLALDVAAALPRLRAMASRDPHREVRAAATATLPLAEAHAVACACPA